MLSPNENHITYDAVNRVNTLITPLKKAGNIDFFCYGVNFPDFSGFTFFSNPEYYAGLFQNEYHFRGFSLNDGWTRDPYQAKDEKAFMTNLGIDNILCYVEHQETMTEIFTFGTPPDIDNIDNFYMNNIHYLKRFACHFIEEAKDFIRAAHNQLVMPTPLMMMSPDPVFAPGILHDELAFEDSLYPLNELSTQEARCLKLMLNGYNNTEIAKSIKVSTKTIDCYINRLKAKFNVDSKIELFQRALQFNLIDYAL